MTAILLVGAVATEPAHQEAREALRSRGQLTTTSTHRGRADIVVGELPPGARTVPAEIAAAARSSMATGVLLWASEPMVRPVAPVGAGNVVLVSPTQRAHVLSGLDILLGAPTVTSGRQALHRQWWSGWAIGAEPQGFDTYQNDATGATFVSCGGAVPARPAGLVATQLLGDAPTDARRSALLRDALGDAALLVHLSPGGGHWLVRWARNTPPLWLFSSLRMPARWSVSATMTAAGVPFVRLPAFPGDLMVSASIVEEDVGELLDKLPLGPLDVFRTLERLVRRPTDWGFVIEAR